jgi:hypothetical protein
MMDQICAEADEEVERAGPTETMQWKCNATNLIDDKDHDMYQYELEGAR